jgi:hypothetical protein
MPRIARPDETMSSVVTTFARNAGFLYVTPVTIAPSWIRGVRAATPPSSVYASSMGSVSGPMFAIWW